MPVVDLSDNNKILIKIDQKSAEGSMAVNLKEICKQKIEKIKNADIHFDFSEVKYFDSASIGTLLYLIQLLKKQDNKVIIDSSSEELKDLFKSLLLDQFLIING